MRVKDYDKKTGNDRYEGYCVELMDRIAKNLSRKYVIQLVKDEKYGNVEENGRWNGMVGELLNDVSCPTFDLMATSNIQGVPKRYGDQKTILTKEQY